jgi:hypothetical protein
MAHYVVVEGAGEVRAVPNLLHRLSSELGHPTHWAPPLRINVIRSTDAEKAGNLVRQRPDAEGLLVLRDDEDGCPRDDAPQLARWMKRLELPFPTACVLFYREYETLFLPCLAELAGKPLKHGSIEREGIRAGALFEGDPEIPRDAKGVVSAAMPSGRAYKETLDQLALTQLLDFSTLRASGLACFATLERALRFLLAGEAAPGTVFPLDR